MTVELWIILVVIAQFFLAIVALIDKFIITSGKIEKPFVFAFYVSVLNIFSLALFVPGLFNIKISNFAFPSILNIGKPDAALFAMAVVFGFTFFHALVSLYSALRDADASDVLPVVGSISAVGTFFLSYLIFDEVLSQNFLVGFALLVVGTALISGLRLKKDAALSAFNAGVLFALNATMVKAMFTISSFDHAFFWSRIGTLGIIISLILVPRYIGKIKFNTKKTKTNAGAWVIGKSILAGVAGFMILKAIDLGNVTLVQALGGLQFAFLTAISLLLGKVMPETCGEKDGLKDVIQKVIATAIILIGFFYLFL